MKIQGYVSTLLHPPAPPPGATASTGGSSLDSTGEVDRRQTTLNKLELTNHTVYLEYLKDMTSTPQAVCSTATQWKTRYSNTLLGGGLGPKVKTLHLAFSASNQNTLHD